jgi:hypothetical protein
MPKPIICQSDAIRQELNTYEELFSETQMGYLETVAMGLVEAKGRRTLTELTREVADEIEVEALSRFFGEMHWSPRLLMGEMMVNLSHRIEPEIKLEAKNRQKKREVELKRRIRVAPVTGYLIIDDSTHEKPYAKKMGGLGYHWSGVKKEVVKGHSMVGTIYHILDHRIPYAVQMYRQKSVCEDEGVAFASKIDLAVGRVLAFDAAKGTHTHVLVDSWYMNKSLYRAARQRGFAISGGIKKNRQIRVTSESGEQLQIALNEYAASLEAEDFELLDWPNEQGGRTIYGHLIQTHVKNLGRGIVLITRPDPAKSQSTYYWYSDQEHLSAQMLVNHLAKRWVVETFFADLKELGSDHYQLHSAQAIVRFWSTLALFYAILDWLRWQLQQAHPEAHFSIGDARLEFQAQQQQNFLAWFRSETLQGHYVEELYPKLAFLT